MKVLILGGTGAMGRYVTDLLSNRGYQVSVTTRNTSHRNDNRAVYLIGDAHNLSFLKPVLEEGWDAIIDFMVYSTEMFKNRAKIFLESTKQYVFISSARVYADSDIITEESPRLLDVCRDAEYLATDEYALTKARQENILFDSPHRNWTIVRPSLTYSENRLQLGVYEKENWLYRALHGRPIVFSEDIYDNFYTLTYGKDVAEGIAGIVGSELAFGEVFHIVVDEPCKWKDVLNLYVDVLDARTGYRPKVVLTKKCTNLELGDAKYQVLYGRYFNRRFDNSKISSIVDTTNWRPPISGLRECLELFLDKPDFLPINWKVEAYLDRASNQRTPLKEIPSSSGKMAYTLYRTHLEGVYNGMQSIRSIIMKR